MKREAKCDRIIAPILSRKIHALRHFMLDYAPYNRV